MKKVFQCLLLLFIMTSFTTHADTHHPPKKAKKIISKLAQRVVMALKNKDFKKLASFIDPSKNLRFTYHSFIRETDPIFSPQQIANSVNNHKAYTWQYGNNDAHLKMSLSDYLTQITYAHDYAKAKQVGYNHMVHSSYGKNNARDYYPKAIMVQYYYPGSNKYGVVNWSDLRLFFEKDHTNNWRLVGVVNDSWAA